MPRFSRFWFWLPLVAFIALPLRAQQGNMGLVWLEQLEKSRAARPHEEVTGYLRTLTVSFVMENGIKTPRLDSVTYAKFVCTRDAKNIRIIYQTEHEATDGQVPPGKMLVFNWPGSGEGTLIVKSSGNTNPTHSKVPGGEVTKILSRELSYHLPNDPLLSFSVFGKNRVLHRMPVSARSISNRTEEVEGTPLIRIEDAAMDGTHTLWINPQSDTLVRRLHLPRPMGGNQSLTVTEARYLYDFTKGQSAVDFDPDTAWASLRPGIALTAGFSPWRELVDTLAKQATEAQTSERGGSKANAPGATPASTPAAATPATVEIQQLSQQQMEAVVLVEGDQGVGTGFIAKIRDIPFVVTNLHVIGGNETLRVKTIRGVTVPVAGIFGAQDRDIAILRLRDDYTGPVLTLAEDPLKTAKLGDKIVVVGNRRGGGVATQVSGVIRGVGPDRLEVDAPFQPGNSGSPIIHLESGEVLGVASYSQTRKLDQLDGPAEATTSDTDKKTAAREQRWFGFRSDAIAKWEAINLVRWRAEMRRIGDFQNDSEAIYYAIYGDLDTARANPRVAVLIDRFVNKVNRAGSNQVAIAQEVNEFFYNLRALAETGVKELKAGEYHNFFRTSQYWESSIPQQLSARAEIVEQLDRATKNSALFISRLRR